MNQVIMIAQVLLQRFLPCSDKEQQRSISTKKERRKEAHWVSQVWNKEKYFIPAPADYEAEGDWCHGFYDVLLNFGVLVGRAWKKDTSSSKLLNKISLKRIRAPFLGLLRFNHSFLQERKTSQTPNKEAPKSYDRNRGIENVSLPLPASNIIPWSQGCPACDQFLGVYLEQWWFPVFVFSFLFTKHDLCLYFLPGIFVVGSQVNRNKETPP